MLLKQDTMNKSLNVGVFNSSLISQAAPYCGDNVFARGLEMNGFDVTRFDYCATPNANNELLRVAHEVNPDLFWFSKCERITAETIRQLKDEFPNATFVKFAADVRDNPTDFDMEHNKYMDYFFGTFGGDYLKRHMTPNMKGACSVLTYVDPTFFQPMRLSEELEKEWASDVLWTGRPGFGDNHLRNEIMDSLYAEMAGKIYNIKMFGPNNWIGNPEYLYAISGTKIGVGSNSFNRRLYSSARLGQYMACGAFYLTQYFDGIEDIFERGVNIDWFETVEEMEEKIKYYLEHDDERQKIAENGRKFIVEHFGCKPLIENILKIIETGQKNYEWDDFYAQGQNN